MTADIVNLNKARKARDRAEAVKRAAENRAKFGRTKYEKEQAGAERRGLDRGLDGAALPPRLDDSNDDLYPGDVS